MSSGPPVPDDLGGAEGAAAGPGARGGRGRRPTGGPVRGVARRLARTPLWLRLVSGTLLLVALAIALTGLFAVRLLKGYLVERVDRQLEAAARPGPAPRADTAAEPSAATPSAATPSAVTPSAATQPAPPTDDDGSPHARPQAPGAALR
jgi:hypothetical protein